MSDNAVRDLLSRALAWQDAHATFDDAVSGIPSELRGRRAENLPYSAWQLLEHLRITQRDILDFCVNSKYQEMNWPDDYWPASAAPPADDAWDASVRACKADRQALQTLAGDTSLDLDATIPHGSGQTYARELVLAIDHSAYHVGQLVLLRRLLGSWRA